MLRARERMQRELEEKAVEHQEKMEEVGRRERVLGYDYSTVLFWDFPTTGLNLHIAEYTILQCIFV